MAKQTIKLNESQLRGFIRKIIKETMDSIQGGPQYMGTLSMDEIERILGEQEAQDIFASYSFEELVPLFQKYGKQVNYASDLNSNMCTGTETFGAYTFAFFDDVMGGHCLSLFKNS